MTVETVVFRKFSDGEIIALFPELQGDASGGCVSYLHVGQHGAADYTHVVNVTRPALPDEYAALADELRGRGYNLKIRKRCPSWRHLRKRG